MNLKDITEEELQTMGYDEIAYLVLENNKKKMKIIDLFKEVCQILNLPESTVEDRITDFFELLSTNKKFVLLPDGFWDLAINHLQEVIIEDEEDILDSEELENEDDMEIIENEEEDDDIYYDSDMDASDDDDDDLKDLVIIDDNDESNE